MVSQNRLKHFLIVPVFLALVFNSQIVTANGDLKPTPEDAALEMSAEEAAAEEEFREAMKTLFPLETDQVKQTIIKTIEQEEATRLPAPENLQTKSRVVSLRPGATVQKVLLMPNYTSTLVFEDSTGAPWPVLSALPGNPNWVNIVHPKEGTGNIISMTSKVYSANMSMVVMLSPNVPLNLQIIINTKVTPDQQVTLRVDRPGPNAASPTVVHKEIITTDPTMLQLLYGIPPEGARRLAVSHTQIEGWLHQKTYYIRSPYKLLWPAFSEVNRTGEGETVTYVYKLPPEPSLLFSQASGDPLNVEIDEEAIQ